MSISKKALLIGIGSTIAVGGITTAIAVPLSQSQSETINRIPSTPLTQATTIQTLLDKIKQEDVVVLSKKPEADVASLIRKSLTETGETNKPIKRNSIYAFDLENTQFALTQEAINKFKTFSGVTFSFEINNEINNSVELNQGMINVTLKASVNEKDAGSVNLKLESFKGINENLSEVLNNNQERHKAVLDLVNVEKAKTLRTVEDLNTKKEATPTSPRRTRLVDLHEDVQPVVQVTKQVSGLSSLLHEVTADKVGKKNLKDWIVEGEVKLDKITSGDNITYFHLVSAKENTKLKLVKVGENGTKEEALVDEVKVTNLLASGIKFVPLNVDDKHQEAYKTKFETEATTNKFKGDKSNGFYLEVKKMPAGQDVVNVAVTPFNIDRKEEKQTLLVNLEVSFGKDSYIKTYKTSDAKDLDELKNGGFNLSIYSKNLNDQAEVVMAEKILDSMDMSKLASYFIKDGLTIPVKNSEIEMNMDSGTATTKVPVGGFSLVSSLTAEYKEGFNLGEVKSTMMNPSGTHRSDTQNVDWVNENWINFVGYSFKGLKNDNAEVTLFIPTINLLHIQEPKAASEGPSVGDVPDGK